MNDAAAARRRATCGHAVIKPNTSSITTETGASAEIDDAGQILVRDNAGRIVIRFDPISGGAEILAPGGDLRLSAPMGSVVLDAADDIVMAARRDLRQVAARRVEIGCEGQEQPTITLRQHELDVTTGTASVTADRTTAHVGEAGLIAEKISTTAKELELLVGRANVRAERWFERFHDLYRDVDGLLQTRAERVRTLIRDTYQLHSRRASLVSKEETSIDGKRVLLG